MITFISYEQILPIWQNELWPDRPDIEPISWMKFLEGYEDNRSMAPTFIGYMVDDQLIGVNSGHMTASGSYRSRGLWVNEAYRGKGIGKALLSATIEQASKEGAPMIWSYPRKSSWRTYQSVGFELASDWDDKSQSNNAFCSLRL